MKIFCQVRQNVSYQWQKMMLSINAKLKKMHLITSTKKTDEANTSE